MRTDCDRRWEIDALREGTLGAKDAEAFQRHARACDVCSGAIARDARLRELAAQLPASEPNELDLRRLRARVLNEIATGRPARPTRLAPLAVAFSLVLVAAVSWAVVHAGLRARAPVASATSAVSPRAAPPAEVTASVAEVERVAGETRSAPRVEEPAGGATHALPSTAARALDRPLKSAASAATASAPVSTAASADDGTDAYAAAVALLQGGQYAAAASAFRAFLLAYPRASQLEDASFLEAAALARAGRSDAAALAAEEHLARFPKSFHRREAAILVARAARDRGDCAPARAVLAPWLGATPPDDEARATLGKCDQK
jgi:hypothetical protein